MKKFTAQHNGQTATRSSKTRDYRWASVVRFSDGQVVVGFKWSATRKNAENCLTRQQQDNGARVIAVVEAREEEPDFSHLERSLGRLVSGNR